MAEASDISEPRIVFDRTPDQIGAHIRTFCRSVAEDAAPIYVPVEADPDGAERACFQIVRERQRRNGGEIIFGWNIWTWPRVWLKAEHHAIWRDFNGRLIDITPKPVTQIVFIADPSRPYGISAGAYASRYAACFDALA